MPAVWLIRHAPAAGNIAGVYMGQRDGEPGAEGLVLAAALAGTVAADTVFTSPLRRAALTAAAIFPDHEIIHDARLVERHLGAWQGEAKTQVLAQQPGAFTAAGTLDLRVTPPGGESLPALCARVHAVLSELAARPGGERIAMVAHNGVLRVARVLLGQMEVDEASVMTERYAEPALVSVDVTTLRPLMAVDGDTRSGR